MRHRAIQTVSIRDDFVHSQAERREALCQSLILDRAVIDAVLQRLVDFDAALAFSIESARILFGALGALFRSLLLKSVSEM